MPVVHPEWRLVFMPGDYPPALVAFFSLSGLAV